MAFSDEKGKAGKRFVQMVDVELDFCQETYGTAPCAAALGVTGTRKCFNTFETCQDTANYNPAAKTYRFIQPRAGLPRSINAYPVLDSIEMAPTRLDPGNSLGKRASVTVRLTDAPHHDRGIDKYVDERIDGTAATIQNSLSFDGTDDYADAGDLAIFDFADEQDFTIEAWVKRGADAQEVVVGKRAQVPGESGNAAGWVFGLNSGAGGNILLQAGDGSSAFSAAGPTANVSSAEGWVHIAVSYDASTETTQFWKNGSDAGSVVASDIGSLANSESLTLGAGHSGADGFFTGEISDVRIWDDVRSGTEIANNKDARLDGDEANLIAYWRLDDGPEESAADSAGDASASIEGATWADDSPLPAEVLEQYEPYQQGTLFGKLRARNPFYLGRKLHVYTGYIPWNHDLGPDEQEARSEQDLLDHLQKRTYVMERWEGPDSRGNFRIVAKDILKLADDDRAQAPKPSTGRLDAGITAGASSATLTPSGVGDEEYPASGRAKIGDEIVEFTRSSDTLTLGTRGDLNTEAETHDQGDTVQLIYEQEGAKSSAIAEDLLVNYASIDASFIDSTAWTNEDDTYIGRLFTGYVVEPTPVVDLVNELSRQAGFFIWWDELNQQIPYKAIRQPSTVTINLADDVAFLEGTIRQKEQPDKRVSQVWVYHGLLTPTDDIDKAKNYATIYVLTESAKEEANAYGRPSIRKVFARWISQTNRAAAEDVAKRLMSRFQDPPRRLEYTLPGARSEVETGDLFNATTRLIQDVTGLSDRRRMLALSKEETKDGKYRIDAEEFLFVEDPDAGTKRVVVTADTNDFKARDEFDLVYASAESGDTVVFEIESGVVVGASTTSRLAWDMQSWPSGVDITVIVNGSIRGKGGDGGGGYNEGDDGGDALYTRYDITLENNGVIAGGGGGGGAGGYVFEGTIGGSYIRIGGGGGGGGAGRLVGSGGEATENQDGGSFTLNPDHQNAEDGEDGTLTTSGDGGAGGDGGSGSTAQGGDGGNGGAPGQAGQAGTDGSGSSGGTDGLNATGRSGGAAGNAINGDSYITYDVTGTITGPQIN